MQKKMHEENIMVDCWRTNLGAGMYIGEKTYVCKKRQERTSPVRVPRKG
jgi:hypothetical protein